MKHIQEKFEGTSIQEWEISHGIVRQVRGGCEYVFVGDRQKFEAACEVDRLRHARQTMLLAAAQEQEDQDEFPEDIF